MLVGLVIFGLEIPSSLLCFRWKKIEKQMNEIQNSATANLSAEDVSVNDKIKLLEDELNELNDTVDDLHGIIKNEEELSLYVERLQVSHS